VSAVYSVWYDEARGSYEVVRWQAGKKIVVQRNIRTRDKADMACDLWRQREAAR
jgi:hypothetical protein